MTAGGRSVRVAGMSRPRRLGFCVLGLAFLAALLGCAGSPDNRALREAVLADPAKLLSSYPNTLALPLDRRIGEIPAVCLDRLRTLDNDESYRGYTLSADERALVLRYLGLLPAGTRRVLEARLVGLYFVSGLIGTGYSDYVLDTAGQVYVVMAFNPACLSTDLGTWMSARERSAFAGTDTLVTVDCGTGYTGFLYGILHESTHAVDYVEGLTPFVEPDLEKIGLSPPARDRSFTTSAWRSYRLPRAREDFPLRNAIGFYGLPGTRRIQSSEASRVYDGLDRSPFVSLYGAQSWAEDLAESVTWYHYVSALGGTYAVTVAEGNGATRTMRPALRVEGRPGWATIREVIYR
jgi:hypothetical protein